jgi:beta-aspartyl-peptidase (threonine type)
MNPRPAILVHGGAGRAHRRHAPEALVKGCLQAARLGYKFLADGGSALDAVEAAVAALEDDPRFNAGTGSVLTRDGNVEMDAAIMEGTHLHAGAVAAVRCVKNPIRLARLVMDNCPHVLLSGTGATAFALEQKVPSCPMEELVTEESKQKLEMYLSGNVAEDDRGTVGAVAIDASGAVAAATSTGGRVGKMPGRIGDSPLLGCGTYADDEGGAASATGNGEAIMRVALTKYVSEKLRAGTPSAQAAKSAIVELTRIGGLGGVIVIDKNGRLASAMNTPHMARAWVSGPGDEGMGFDA